MAPGDRSLPRTAAVLLWRRLPETAARLSGTLRLILRDGDYLLAWPVAAAAAPPAALLLGLVLGAAHPGPVFASSLLVTLILAAVAGTGAALGGYTLLGYAAGDLLLHHEAGFPPAGSVADTLLRTDLGRLGADLTLAGLLVLAPMAASAGRRQSERFLKAGPARFAIGFAVSGVLLAVLGYLWSQSAAFLLRPVWTFWTAYPADGSLRLIVHNGVWVALAALLGLGGRAALTVLAGRRPAPPRPAAVHYRQPPAWPWAARAIPRAALLALLLAGLVSTAAGGALVFAVLMAAGAARYLAVPRLRGYLAVVRRIPLALRIAACCLLGYLMAAAIVPPDGQPYVPLLLALALPVALGAFLFPGAPLAPRPEPAPTPAPAPAPKPAPESAAESAAADRRAAE